MIWSVKFEAYQKVKPSSAQQKEKSENLDLSEIEIEIDNTFFKKKLIPQIHKTMMSSLP